MNTKHICMDEAYELFSAALEGSDAVQTHQMNTICELARERGIHLIAFSQYPAGIAKSVSENFPVKMIVGALGDESSYRPFGESLGMDKDMQQDARTHKTPGLVYVSDYRCKAAFRCVVPDVSFLKARPVSQETVRDSARRFLDSIQDQIVPFKPSPRQPHPRQPSNRPSAHSTAPATEHPISEDAHALLQLEAERHTLALTKHGDPRLLIGLKPIFEQLRITSGTRKKALDKELTDAGMWRSWPLRVGKYTYSVHEVTQRGWALLNLPPPQLSGKGSWFHQYLVRLIEHCQRAQGRLCTVEGRLKDKAGFKQADVLVQDPDSGSTIAYEVPLSRPAKEVENAKQDILEAGVDRVVFACPVSATAKQVKKAIDRCPDLKPVRDRMQVTLVSNILKELSQQ